MKLNRKWLNEEFVDLSNVSDKEFVETLTVFGQKVETWERLDAEIKNVVVGKVLSMMRHPISDHMLLCPLEVALASSAAAAPEYHHPHGAPLIGEPPCIAPKEAASLLA